MPGGHLGRRVDLVRRSEGRNALGEHVAVKRLKVTAGEAAHRELKIADGLAGKKFDHVNSAIRVTCRLSSDQSLLENGADSCDVRPREALLCTCRISRVSGRSNDDDDHARRG
jgi:hypothetical protein